MGIYGESVLLVQEAVDRKRENLMYEIAESIDKTLFDLGVNADTSVGIIFGGAWGFKRNKRDSFEIQVNLNKIDTTIRTTSYDKDGNRSVSYSYDYRAEAENEKNRFEAKQIITKNMDKIKANLKRDVKSVDVKIERPEDNFNYGLYFKIYVVEK